MSTGPAISTGQATDEPTESAVRYYLSLPYRIALARDEGDDDQPWRAQVEELPGCEVTGATPAEAAERVPSAIAEFVAAALAEGRDVPEPRSPRSYSGKLLLRMPLTLHAELARAAERDQVSLNAYITGQLAAAIGWRKAGLPAAGPGAGAREQSEQPSGRAARARLYWWALVINLTVVGIAAALAVLLLLTAWNNS
jgi:antitoxin HicB